MPQHTGVTSSKIRFVVSIASIIFQSVYLIRLFVFFYTIAIAFQGVVVGGAGDPRMSAGVISQALASVGYDDIERDNWIYRRRNRLVRST